MKNIVQTMTALIASEVCGKAIDPSQDPFSDEELAALYKLSKAHDLAHLVGDALIKNKLISNAEIKSKFEKQLMTAVYRYERINYELNCLRTILNDAKMPFIPLKGSIIRRYYPEPWMRTSCDIDILVREEQVDEAAQLLVDRYGYTYEKKNYHDISLMSGSGVHLELHYSIKERKDNIDSLLSKCWSYAVRLEGFEYGFTNEFFLFHQFAHASYHFLGGGCGIRPFIDVFLLEKKLSFNRGKLDEMLQRTGIKKFSDEMLCLANLWFGNGEHDSITRSMEQFVLTGGVYGTAENSVAVSQQKERGRIGYILRRIWLPYDLLCTTYPRLKGRRYLQPFYEIRRWFRVFNVDARKRKKNDLNAIKQLSPERKDNVNQMLKELELGN